MNNLDLITTQRQQEAQSFKQFLLIGLLSSVALHAIAMMSPTVDVWKPAEIDAELEVVVENVENSEEPPQPEAAQPEVTLPQSEPLPQEVAFAPDVAPPPPIPLAPDTSTSQPEGEDAPAPDDLQPMTGTTGNEIIQPGGGPITKPGGQGSGFGFAPVPSGFASAGGPDGSPDGQPGGSPNGVQGGVLGGTPGGTGTTAVRTAPPATAPTTPGRSQPVCLSCPKPKFQGTEASPRVDMRIRPDGSVEVRLRKSSGNPNLDRATLETMSQWRFDPKTVPQEGINKRVRVTYEEEGSSFQHQNETRRRQEVDRQRESERQRVAEQERRQTADRERTPTTTVEPATQPITPRSEVEPSNPPPAPVPEASTSAPTPEPPPVAPPAPVPEVLPPPEPAPEAPPVAPPPTTN